MTTVPEDNLLLIKRILGKSYLDVKINSLSVLDNLENGKCSVQLYLHDGLVIEATGVGIVDAIFSGLKDHFRNQFPSLNGLELVNFFVKAKTKGTASEVDVVLEIRNSYGKYFTFKDDSKSLTASAARASVAVVEYFCNSESAFFAILNAFKDAKSRGREDLADRYIEELSFLVKNTNYSDLLSALKKEFK